MSSSSPLTIQRIDTSCEDVGARLRQLRERLSPRGDVVSEHGRRRTMEVFGEPLSPQRVVERICNDVRRDGLTAVLKYSEQLDHAALDAQSLRVPAHQLAEAHRQADPQLLASVRRIRENVEEFQQAILHRDVEIKRPDGVVLRQRYVPLDRVGVCVPGGAAAYPSTVLMTVVPALTAGVRDIAVVAPPTDFGANNPTVLAVCAELGVQEVYRVGGAQGVAALAYGAGPIQPVDKIVGPGNLFVALAKKYVFGEVDIDAIAGPSEVVVLADETTSPVFAAADLLAQAEHAPGASILISWASSVIERTHQELQRQVARLERQSLTLQSLADFGALILARDVDEACRLTNELAPEHLHIAAAHPQRLLDRIHHAGAIFLGPYSPIALGDYAAGPSHVLPTSGTARWASGLSANEFLRAGSVIEYSQQALRNIADDVRRMADLEGLTAHRASIDVRFQ